MLHQQDARTVLLASRRQRFQAAVLWREIRRLASTCDGPRGGVVELEPVRPGDRLRGPVLPDLGGPDEAESLLR